MPCIFHCIFPWLRAKIAEWKHRYSGALPVSCWEGFLLRMPRQPAHAHKQLAWPREPKFHG